MTTQPEALRLADELCEPVPDYHAPTSLEEASATELRRQHSEIEKLKAERDALKADAERYQLLKSRVEEYDGHACFPDIPLPCPIPDDSPFDRIDAAIDAAREKT